MKRQLPKLRKSAEDRQEKVDRLLHKYVEQVDDLVRFGRDSALGAISELEGRTTKVLYERVYDLLRKHTNHALVGRIATEK